MYRITTNTALFTIKKERSLHKNYTQFKTIENPIEFETVDSSTNELKIKKLYKAISTLKEIDRIIIGLLLEDCSYAEIATITGMSISNVGVRINRIKKSLNKKLK